MSQSTLASPGPADLISPVAGVPLSAVQVEQWTRTLPDGSVCVEKIISKVHRDPEGRLRIDSELADASSGSRPIHFLLDPMTGERVIMLDEDKTALRMLGPKRGEDGFASGFAGSGQALPPGDWQYERRNLGTRLIEGLEVQGERITWTCEQPRPLNAIKELWYSSSLKLTALSEASGPLGRNICQLQQVHLGRPDPSLFSVPPGYTIKDVGSPNP